MLGDDRAEVRIGARDPFVPHNQTVGHDVAVEIRIEVGAAVVASPAVGVQRSNRLDVTHLGRPAVDPRHRYVLRLAVRPGSSGPSSSATCTSQALRGGGAYHGGWRALKVRLDASEIRTQ